MRKNSKLMLGLLVLLSLSLAACAASSNGQNVALGEVTRVTIVDTVEGSGAITPRHAASLTWQTSGTVGSIRVRVGQRVKAGEILAALAPESLSPAILQAQVDLAEAQRNLETVQHSSLARAQAQLALAEAQQAVKDAERNYYNVTGKRASSETIENAEAQYALAMKRVDEAQKIYDQYASLPDDNPLKAQAYSNLYAAWQARDRALATLNWYLGKPSEIDIAKAEAQLAVAKAQLEDAQREWERLKDGPDPNDVVASQAAVQEAQNRVNAQYLIAPFDGEVVFINNEPGDVVEAGSLGIELLDRSRLSVTVSVDESKILQVQVGDKATVVAEALPDLTLNGKVTAINPLGTVNQGVLYFDVRVELDESDPRLLVGMTADVTIQLGEPRAALTVPAAAVQSDDAGEYVYLVKADGSYQRVDVVSGRILDDDRVEVSGDLQPGDRVLLLSSAATTTTFGGRGEPGAGGVIMRGMP